ncbi:MULTISPECIES: M23 family metallopeptidase [Paenibacillus]|uniref:M23 family metallopeptidase n=1 Tax=Paenibacillus TaxID=44249 RepID=UPI0022B9289C|nr:M23 family metallopeptidase [Paenibacillus caseinilyticus]MCZ8523207.1 M23 family metallopeptidase [Paenibacillus caseinilyticus]
MKKIWTHTVLGAALLSSAVVPAVNAHVSSESGSARAPETAIEASGPEAAPDHRPIRPQGLPRAFAKGEYTRIHSQLGPELQAHLSAAELEQMGKPFFEAAGPMERLTQIALPAGKQYLWANAQRTKGLMAVFAEDGRIAGLLLQPMVPHPETDRLYTQGRYRMPITGSWFVYWGGTNELLNYHYAYESQRYAYDLVVSRKDGTTFDGDPATLESYYAYGKEVTAPAGGTVAGTLNSVPDNTPVGQTTNTDQPFGNYVVIDHGGGEFSVIGHLQQGSVKVKPGDAVTTGDVIGFCGNSGNSSEPHIHFQVQNSPEPGQGQSLRIRQAHGQKEPVKGDMIRGPRGG